MGMLLRTRKVALGLKVFTILAVTSTYAFLSYLSPKTSPKGHEDNIGKNNITYLLHIR